MKTEFILSGYLKGKRVFKSTDYGFDGKKLDTLIIAASIESQKDVTALIHLLEVHKFCFETPHQKVDL